MTVYAIPNCNTVKNALNFLKDKGITYDFHDFKKKGISTEKLNEWCALLGWEKVLNKNGLTWKKQDESTKSKVINQATAVAFLKENTSAIKRPVLEFEGKLLIGFNPEEYAAQF